MRWPLGGDDITLIQYIEALSVCINSYLVFYFSRIWERNYKDAKAKLERAQQMDKEHGLAIKVFFFVFP